MIGIAKWSDVIDNCKYDELVGIKMAKLAGDKNFSTFITAIDPKKSVNPHYHKHGEEHYHIIKGTGEIRLKNITTGDAVSYHVSALESFVVPENFLHQLTNTGTEPLLLMFSCPTSHLDTDRFFL